MKCGPVRMDILMYAWTSFQDILPGHPYVRMWEVEIVHTFIYVFVMDFLNFLSGVRKRKSLNSRKLWTGKLK